MRAFVIAALALDLTVLRTGGAEPDGAFAGWPQGWADGYRRFGKFIAAQVENVPASDLEISSGGQVHTSLPAKIDSEMHTSIALYGNGAEIMKIGLGHAFFEESQQYRFPPGTYAACLQTCDKLVGYQFRHPITWLRVGRTEVNDRTNQIILSVETIDQPEPSEDYWPNDRFLRYYDFQVIPHNNPLGFLRKNGKVTPDISLTVTNNGVIQREKLDTSLERLLRWRIYFNGRLVAQSQAAGDLRYPVTQGTGTYVAFIGVEGPDGFMPVSNLLQFPLFPERDGSLAVLPSVNENGVPHCLITALAPDQMDHLRQGSGWASPYQGYNKATIYDLGSIGPIADEEKSALVSLWSAWAWSLDMAKAQPDSAVARVHVSAEAK